VSRTSENHSFYLPSHAPHTPSLPLSGRETRNWLWTPQKTRGRGWASDTAGTCQMFQKFQGVVRKIWGS
jgi:hypothetical protein